MTYLKNFLKDEEGQDMVEYALLLAFISIIAVVAVTAVGSKVNTKFEAVSGALT